MKKLIVFALLLALSFSVLTACDNGGDTADYDKTTTAAQSGDNGETKIDLSQFTPKELAASSLLEDWMKPEFGVITSGGETMKDFMYQFTISGVTKVNEESYRELIVSKGFEKTSDYTYKKDGLSIALGTAGIGTTTDSIMTVSIEKS